jgi:hypothetical protein
MDELDPEDHIIATYNLKAAQGVLPEPSTNVTVNYIPVDGNIAITPANIGLGNVNNTSDINKPISNAQQAINVLRLEGNFEHIQTETCLQLVDKTRNAKVSFSNCNRN